MVAVGYLASKKNVLPAESNQYLVNLILTITNPCLIISSMSSQTLSSDTVRQACEILIGASVFFLAAARRLFSNCQSAALRAFRRSGCNEG